MRFPLFKTFVFAYLNKWHWIRGVIHGWLAGDQKCEEARGRIGLVKCALLGFGSEPEFSMINLFKKIRSCISSFKNHVKFFLFHLIGREPFVIEISLIQLNPMPSWCRIHKIFWRDIGFLESKIPKGILQDASPFFLKFRFVPIYDQYLTRIRGAKIADSEGWLFSPENELIREHRFFWKNLNFSSSCYFIHKKRKTILNGPIYNLAAFGPNSYYHWMLDVLSRLEVVIEELPVETKFLVPSSANKVQLDVLQAYDIFLDRMIFISNHEIVQCDDLWWNPPVMNAGFHLPLISQALSNRLRRRLFSNEGPRKIYISRSDAFHRKVLNETDLIHELEARGFLVLKCGSMGLVEQANAFMNAEMIIAPHGAGLTNLIFASGKCRVLEFLSAKTPKGGVCYWSLCLALGIDYSYLLGKDAASESCEPDYYVDIDSVLDWVDIDSK